jgi:RNA polymerase sigma-70 factor (ECF subfamily)
MLPEGISDAECVKLVQQGDTGCFETLVRRHQKGTFNLVYRLLGDYDEAAEVAQEVFLSAYRSIDRFRGDANFSTWLYRIAFNHASTRRKTLKIYQQRFVPLDGIEVTGESAADPVRALEQREAQEHVQQALNTLNREDALIILLRDLQDVPYDQVAAILEIPVGTVKSRLHRARKALKTKLDSHLYPKRKST